MNQITSSAAQERHMQEWLKIILPQIAAGALLPPTFFAALDCDAALNARDSDEAA